VIVPTVDVLGDLLRAALDDTPGAHLPPIIERRVVARMAELAELAGLVIERPDPTRTPAWDL